MENREMTSQTIKLYHGVVHSYAEDKSILWRRSMGISKASKMTAHMWQFYRKYIELNKNELKTLVFDSTYINDDKEKKNILGRTVLMI